MTPRWTWFPALLGLVAGGCAPPDSADEAATGAAPQTIVGATEASDFPEAVLVDIERDGHMIGACSGSLVAPRIVLTAGHCVHNFDGWRITAPYASGQSVKSKRGATYDWNNESERVDPTEHDVGLVFLDEDIQLPSYPNLAAQPLSDGSLVVRVGRIDDGHLSRTDLFASPPGPVRSAEKHGFPYDYIADQVIQRGDSGGPVFEAGTHKIVAVNSGAGLISEVLARVDLVSSWLDQRVASGGPGGTPEPGGPPPVKPASLKRTAASPAAAPVE